MPETPTDALTPQPFFHPDSGAVRFWVAMPDGGSIGAIVRKEILHYCFQGDLGGEGALDTFEAHRAEIEDVVRQRAARGSIEPVLLREADFGARSRRV